MFMTSYPIVSPDTLPFYASQGVRGVDRVSAPGSSEKLFDPPGDGKHRQTNRQTDTHTHLSLIHI